MGGETKRWKKWDMFQIERRMWEYLISFTFLFLLPSLFFSTYINIFLLHHVFQINLLVPTSKHNAVPSRSTWLAVLIALVGLFLLSGSRLDDLELGEGHIHLLLCVFFLSRSLSKLLPAFSPLPHSSPIIRVKDSSGVTCFLYISLSLSLTLSLPNSVSLCLSLSLSLSLPLSLSSYAPHSFFSFKDWGRVWR